MNHSPAVAAPPLHLERVCGHLLVAPVAEPVRNSFRVLTERTALLVQVTDADGVSGWGEIWSNYPPGGASHRANLLQQVVAPLIAGKTFAGPGAAFHVLEKALRVPALQCGEFGPFAQVAAGVDMALWDLAARKLRLPLWKWLGGVREVRVYASGLGPQKPENIAARMIEQGHRAVKLKVGFGAGVDDDNVRRLRALVGDQGEVMLDANQRWDVDAALAAARGFAGSRPLWLEEPVPADEMLPVWQTLARQSPVALAAGENLRGLDPFSAMLDAGVVCAIQPDIGKWGGFTGCLEVARRADETNTLFCPHWLGGGLGLLATLHLLAGTGGRGWGEIDANHNALREQFLFPGFAVAEGRVALNDEPGLGFVPDDALLRQYRK